MTYWSIHNFLKIFAHEVKWLTKYIFKDFRWKQCFNILYLYICEGCSRSSHCQCVKGFPMVMEAQQEEESFNTLRLYSNTQIYISKLIQTSQITSTMKPSKKWCYAYYSTQNGYFTHNNFSKGGSIMLFLPWFSWEGFGCRPLHLEPQTLTSIPQTKWHLAHRTITTSYWWSPSSHMNESCNACREEIVLENLENFHLET